MLLRRASRRMQGAGRARDQTKTPASPVIPAERSESRNPYPRCKIFNSGIMDSGLAAFAAPRNDNNKSPPRFFVVNKNPAFESGFSFWLSYFHHLIPALKTSRTIRSLPLVRGALARRRDGGAGGGARASVSQTESREASGHRPPALRQAAFNGWNGDRNRRAKALRDGGA